MLKITHRCGHVVKYDAHGSVSFGLQLLNEKKEQPCPNCKAVGIQAKDLLAPRR
jgi:hypothetical protein